MPTNKKISFDERMEKINNEYKTTNIGVDNIIPTYRTTKAQKVFNTKPNKNGQDKNEENIPNLPKPKTLFFVHFDLNDSFFDSFDGDNYRDKLPIYKISKKSKREILFQISKLVKEYDKPKFTMKTTVLNEYNRKRIIYKNPEYNNIKIKFYDVRDNIVQIVFLSYLRAINSDLMPGDKDKWLDAINTKNYSDNIDFGLTKNSNIQFFKNISFCEYFMNTLTVYTIKNPKITDISFGNSKMGDFESNVIEVEFQYEGVTNNIEFLNIRDIIGTDITKNQKIANFLQLRYDATYHANFVNKKSEYSSAPEYNINMYNIKTRFTSTPPPKSEYRVEMYKINKRSDKLKQEVTRDVWSLLKSYMNKDVEFSWNTVKNQVLDTARKYGFAEEANALAQLELSSKIIKNNTFKENIKYGINMIADPTTVVGTVSKSLTDMSSNTTKKIGGWFI